MAVEASIEIAGLKEALKTLNSIDKSLRRQVTKDYKEIVQVVIDDAQKIVGNIQSRNPKNVPLSGMARNWTTKSGFKMLPWLPGYEQSIKAKINTRNIKEFNGRTTNVGTFSIAYLGSTGTLLDMSSNGSLGRNLTAQYGDRSRVMWKAWERNEANVMDEMDKLVRRVMKQVGQELR